MLFSKNKIFSLTLVAFMGTFLPDLACASNPNKESFPPLAAIFSSEKEIDYPRLQAHLHHKFQNTDLLRDALYPMLPQRLQGKKNDFDLLEWRGDAVLELVMTDRLIEMFPGHDRGHLSMLGSHLVKNKTLTEIYLWNLDLERYLPCPNQNYKICNVVEALVGAIYKDDRRNGLDNARRFVMRLLDEETTQVEIQALLGKRKHLSFTPSVSPEQDEALKAVCTPARLFKENPKSLLNEVLLKIFDERPEYVTHFDMDEKGQVVFVSHVVAAQVGKKNEGRGRTQQQAEENAALQALISLSRGPLGPSEPLPQLDLNFRYYLSEMIKFLGVKERSDACQGSVSPFKFKIILDGQLVGEGEGSTKAKAEEAAAQKACAFIIAAEKSKRDAREALRLGQFQTIRAATLKSAAEAKLAAAAKRATVDAALALAASVTAAASAPSVAVPPPVVAAAPASVAASASSVVVPAPVVTASVPVTALASAPSVAVPAPVALKPAVATSAPSGSKQQPSVANTKGNGRGEKDHKKQNQAKVGAPAKVAVPKAGVPKSVPSHKQNQNTKPH
ncbi:MAG: hypothetical protein C0514_08235 [Candidatus Puniceispirillum sp.]|nr:hypothetical protein [Candidatus Puniceispirillum sp.]